MCVKRERERDRANLLGDVVKCAEVPGAFGLLLAAEALLALLAGSAQTGEPAGGDGDG